MKVPYWDLQAQYAECKEEIDKGIADIIQDSEYIGGKIQSDFEANLIRYTGAQDVATVSCLLYTSPSPRDLSTSRMPSSA